MPRFGSLTGSSAGATVTVAASNSPTKWRNIADYVCDGVADQTEINAAIVEAATYGIVGNGGSSVYLYPGQYTLSATIAMSSPRITLFGFGSGYSQGVAIVATALGSSVAAITCSGAGSGTLIEGLAITSGGYGIEYTIGSQRISKCYVYDCGNYGIYIHNGANTFLIDGCDIQNNTTAGIYSVSPNSGEQNGNALRIIGNRVSSLAGSRAIVWNAASLVCIGNDINTGSIGLDIGSNTTNQPRGAYIAGNYFETFTVAAIRIGDSGASVATHNNSGMGAAGIEISGNFIDISGAGHGIQLSSLTGGLISASNIFSGGGGGGNSINTISASEGVEISMPLTNYGISTYGSAILLGDYALNAAATLRILLSGDTEQVGMTWAAGSYQSSNFAGAGAQTAYFKLPTKAGDYLTSFSLNAGGDASDTTVATLERLSGNIGGAYGTTWDTVTLDSGSDTNPSAALNASGGIVWTCNHRIESGYAYRLKLLFTPAGGGTRTVRSPTMHYVTE